MFFKKIKNKEIEVVVDSEPYDKFVELYEMKWKTMIEESEILSKTKIAKSTTIGRPLDTIVRMVVNNGKIVCEAYEYSASPLYGEAYSRFDSMYRQSIFGFAPLFILNDMTDCEFEIAVEEFILALAETQLIDEQKGITSEIDRLTKDKLALDLAKTELANCKQRILTKLYKIKINCN